MIEFTMPELVTYTFVVFFVADVVAFFTYVFIAGVKLGEERYYGGYPTWLWGDREENIDEQIHEKKASRDTAQTDRGDERADGRNHPAP